MRIKYCMLTEKEKKFIKRGKEFKGDENLKSFYRKKIRDKAKTAMSDLAFVSDNITTDQFKKIFLQEEVKEFIVSLSTPTEEPEDYEEFYKSYKLREEILEEFESNIRKWKQLLPYDVRIDVESRTYWGNRISQLTQALEEHDKEIHPEDRILRVCDKWLNLKKIVDKTELPEEKVREIRDELVKEEKLIVQKPSYRYKAVKALSEEEKEKHLPKNKQED